MTADDPILTVAEVRRLEETLARQGTPLLELMRRAGRAIAGVVEEAAGPGAVVTVLCGTGNNGGDGWVVADLLAGKEMTVHLVSARHPEDVRAEPARSAIQETIARDHPDLRVHVAPDPVALDALLAASTVVVDAILGTGFDGVSVRPPYSSWIEATNNARLHHPGLTVVAADTPSGLSADSGRAAIPTIQADLTVTMLAHKPGLLASGAHIYCGELRLAHLRDTAN